MMDGEHSAPYTGVVVDFAPTAKPSKKRAKRRDHQEWAAIFLLALGESLTGESHTAHPETSSKADEA